MAELLVNQIEGWGARWQLYLFHFNVHRDFATMQCAGSSCCTGWAWAPTTLDWVHINIICNCKGLSNSLIDQWDNIPASAYLLAADSGQKLRQLCRTYLGLGLTSHRRISSMWRDVQWHSILANSVMMWRFQSITIPQPQSPDKWRHEGSIQSRKQRL